MQEKVRQLIADQTLKKAQLKLMLRNLATIGELTDQIQNDILDELQLVEETIEMLRKVSGELR